MQRQTSERRSYRAALWFGLRVLLTLGVFAYLFSKIQVADLSLSLLRIPTLALLGSLLAYCAGIATGMLRWRLLLRAYGATQLPTLREVARWYMVSLFYNLLPGAIGGDVYRGVVTRNCFADGATTRSVSVVFVERVLGLSGLLVLTGGAALLVRSFDPRILLWSAAGLVAAVGAVSSLALGRRLSPLLPERLARFARTLPSIERPGAFCGALLVSGLSHIPISLAGHVLAISLAPQLRLVQSMVIFPLAALASYFPLTVAGAGARDAALISLLGQVSVPRSDALAVSLSLLLGHFVISSVGGLLPLAANDARDAKRSAHE